MVRRDCAISVYARIFGVDEQQVPAALAERVGSSFGEQAFQGAAGSDGGTPTSPPASAATP